MSTNTGILVFILLLIIIGGGIALYFYYYPGKPKDINVTVGERSMFDRWMETASKEDIEKTMESL